MFDDEMRTALKRMHEFSAADGFVEITESVGDTVKNVANEPSVGLYFVQQHTKNAAPNLIKLKNNISDKSHETTLHSQDLDDSMAVVKSMKECGNPVVGEMIKDINKSLSIMATKEPKIGLTSSPSSNFHARRTSLWGLSGWGHNSDGKVMENHMLSVVTSAKEKVTNFKWPLFNSREWRQSEGKRVVSYTDSLQVRTHNTDKLPVSSPSKELVREESTSSSSHKWVPLLDINCDDFQADREAKLEKWLGGEADEDCRLRGNGDGF